MGQSWNSGRRRSDHYYTPATTPSPPLPALDPPPPSRRRPPPPPPPPPPPAASTFASYPSPHYPNYYQPSACSPFPSRPSFCHYYAPAPPGASSWWPPQPIPPNYPSSSAWFHPAPAHNPPPYVDSQQARTVKNDVNVHKETICLVVDGESPDQYLVSFTFDAAVDGSITISYFAKEGEDGSFSSVYPELCKPKRISFKKGPGQKFRQSREDSIDLGFFELDDLSNCTNNIFPLVICAEADQSLVLEQDEKKKAPAQITLAVIEKRDDGGPFHVRVIKQILLIDGQRYELREIFGLEGCTETKVDEEDGGKECVICMSEPRDTTVLPCRHMCMCRECAKALRLQTNKCPICRQPVEQLLEIKVINADP